MGLNVQVHLYHELFFSKYVLPYYTIWGWLNPQMGNYRYGGPAINLYADFRQHIESVPLIPEFLKGQLYSAINYSHHVLH